MPKISVVMSVYNGEKYLKEAIDSVIAQTFKDFEFIIINDGSTDNSLSIINSYDDNRIKLLNNDKNMGLIYSLNRGFEVANGKYIIRFDADDICLKNRFQVQYDYMEENNDVAMMSAYATWFIDGKNFIRKTIKSDMEYEKIKAKFIFENHINHSCVILRNEIIKKESYRYDSKYLHIEDYGLWLNIAKKYKVTTLDKSLLLCRISRNSVTSMANRDMKSRQMIYKIIYDEIYNLIGYKPSEEDYNIHFEICMIQNLNDSKYSMKEKSEYCKRLIECNKNLFVKNEYLINECDEQLYKNSLYTNKFNEYCKVAFKNVGIKERVKSEKDRMVFLTKKIIKKKVR